jgi:5-methylcytosine-specific restriction endonuclease McrBC regulatory subunit McrC
MSDPVVIKELKEVANRVLQNASSSQNAWRLNFAEFFERYVQYLLKEVARTKGARITCNPHFPIYGNRPAWALKYIEPDIIIDKSDVQYIIDAKYKSHIYQINGDSEQLRETFREDFHQVLSYSSFCGSKQKHIMLIYPSDHFVSRELDVLSGINGYSAKAYLVGIPLKKSDLEETKQKLSSLIVL